MELTNGKPAVKQHILLLRLRGIEEELYYVLSTKEREKVERHLREWSKSDLQSEMNKYLRLQSDSQDLTAVVALDGVQFLEFLPEGTPPPLLALCEDRMLNTRIHLRWSSRTKDYSIADRDVAERLIKGFTGEPRGLDQFETFTSVEGEVVWLRRAEVLVLEVLTSFLRGGEHGEEQHPSLHVWNMDGVSGR